mmetsp:Transcript_35719/g.71643  ORF Transcript_35719/g.71643 Transcript_35719/m.71643 type:complete len:214 (-) Transcript_35719:435-1076(-)
MGLHPGVPQPSPAPPTPRPFHPNSLLPCTALAPDRLTCGGGGFLGVGLAVQDVHRHQRNLAVVLLGRPCLEAEVALLPGLRDHHRVVRRQHDRDQHRHRREPLGRAVVDGTVGAGAVDLVALGLRVQRREYLEGHEGGDEGAGHDAGGRHPLRRAEREHRQEQKQDEVEGGEEGVELAAALLCRVRRVLSEPAPRHGWRQRARTRGFERESAR